MPSKVFQENLKIIKNYADLSSCLLYNYTVLRMAVKVAGLTSGEEKRLSYNFHV